MQEYLIIDGYNIIHAWPEFARDKGIGLEHARARLVAIFADYVSFSGQKVVVVFDAYRQKNLADRAAFVNGVEVLYTRQGETADTLIERLSGELTARGKVYVATSDWAEQGIIFGQGAYRITPGELRAMVKLVKDEIRELWPKAGLLDGYLENRLNDAAVRSKLEDWRREKGK